MPSGIKSPVSPKLCCYTNKTGYEGPRRFRELSISVNRN